MVVIKDLYKQYSDKIAIQDISFKLKPGSVTDVTPINCTI